MTNFYTVVCVTKRVCGCHSMSFYIGPAEACPGLYFGDGLNL